MSESKKRIALLSNITADLIAGKLRKKYDFYLCDFVFFYHFFHMMSI